MKRIQDLVRALPCSPHACQVCRSAQSASQGAASASQWCQTSCQGILCGGRWVKNEQHHSMPTAHCQLLMAISDQLLFLFFLLLFLLLLLLSLLLFLLLLLSSSLLSKFLIMLKKEMFCDIFDPETSSWTSLPSAAYTNLGVGQGAVACRKSWHDARINIICLCLPLWGDLSRRPTESRE